MRYLFIPSCEVKKKDRLANTTTEKRLERGLQLWQRGGYDAIIVSGGIYLPPHIQTVAAGLIMKSWLLERGVPFNNVIWEDRSRDTYENIFETLLLLSSDPDPQFTVVTHWQHALRFRVTFRLVCGLKIRTEPMYYSIGFKGFILEWLMLLYHLWDKNGTGKIATSNRENRTF